MTTLNKLDALAKAVTEAMRAVEEAATAYAIEQTLLYSKSHPKRTVVFCSAMGTTTLHVSRGPILPINEDYQFHESEQLIWSRYYRAIPFLVELARIERDVNTCTVAGPLRLECKGGEIVSLKTDW